jgi:hypothetical protein
MGLFLFQPPHGNYPLPREVDFRPGPGQPCRTCRAAARLHRRLAWFARQPGQLSRRSLWRSPHRSVSARLRRWLDPEGRGPELGPDVSAFHFDHLIRKIQIHPHQAESLRCSQSCRRSCKNQGASWLWDVEQNLERLLRIHDHCHVVACCLLTNPIHGISRLIARDKPISLPVFVDQIHHPSDFV